MKLGLNQYTGYTGKKKVSTLGRNYVFFGFLPSVDGRNNNVPGLHVNWEAVRFTNTDKSPNSYIILFPTSRNWILPIIFIPLIFLSVVGSLMRHAPILLAESFQTSSSSSTSCTGAEVVATVRRMHVSCRRAFVAQPSVLDRHCAAQMLSLISKAN